MKNDEYRAFFLEVKSRIRDAQYEAMKIVNTHLINLYWELGKMIVEKQEQFNWGKSVVENLSLDLQKEFPGVQGFSKSNLWAMSQFYLQYNGNEFCNASDGNGQNKFYFCVKTGVRNGKEKALQFRIKNYDSSGIFRKQGSDKRTFRKIRSSSECHI